MTEQSWLIKDLLLSQNRPKKENFSLTNPERARWGPLLACTNTLFFFFLFVLFENIGERARASVKRENERAERERKITSPLPARVANQKVGFASSCPLSLFVLSFAPRGFSAGTPVFSPPQKPAVPNSNSTRNQVDEEPLS